MAPRQIIAGVRRAETTVRCVWAPGRIARPSHDTPNRSSGAWVFHGTRLPIAALLENLQDGACIEEFLAWFPGVERSQIEAVLDTEAAAARSPR